eukprot:sb/3469430/
MQGTSLDLVLHIGRCVTACPRRFKEVISEGLPIVRLCVKRGTPVSTCKIGSWSDWSPCTDGIKLKTRRVAPTPTCAGVTPISYARCYAAESTTHETGSPPCSTDEQWSDWEYENCDDSCNWTGRRKRRRRRRFSSPLGSYNSGPLGSYNSGPCEDGGVEEEMEPCPCGMKPPLKSCICRCRNNLSALSDSFNVHFHVFNVSPLSSPSSLLFLRSVDSNQTDCPSFVGIDP